MSEFPQEISSWMNSSWLKMNPDAGHKGEVLQRPGQDIITTFLQPPFIHAETSSLPPGQGRGHSDPCVCRLRAGLLQLIVSEAECEDNAQAPAGTQCFCLPFGGDQMLNQRKPNTKQIWRVWIFYMAISANCSEEKAMTQVCPSCDATHFCDCSSMDLSTIPSGLTTDVTGLNLSYNSIDHVRETDLKLGVNLRLLLLQSNQIRTIDKDSFIFLGKLEHLDLSNNKLTHLSPIWFRHLFSLQQLNIQGNLYTTLGENPLFSNLKNLRYLHLGNNHSFSAIRKQVFDGITVLEQLEIDGQRLRQYESGSLTTVNSINHIIININDVQVLSVMLEDLINSVICLELRHIAFNTANESSLLEPMSRSVMEKLVFKNVLFTDASVIRVLNILRHAKQLLELEVDDSVLRGTGKWHGQIEVNGESTIEVITVQRLGIEQFYLFSDLSGVENLLGNITKTTVINTNVFLVPCSISKRFSSLLYLDLSENLLADPTLEHSSCK
ncbi:toll-like receptor 2, partial [Terrapene carolina triunguis]|uniref:toll-like receptor 2 n=1 Tax=Terrapene triunguis TaxID=2587831 RepID=UPI00115639E7